MDNLSWGTREGKSATEAEEAEEALKKKVSPLFKFSCSNLFDCLCCFINENKFYAKPVDAEAQMLETKKITFQNQKAEKKRFINKNKNLEMSMAKGSKISEKGDGTLNSFGESLEYTVEILDKTTPFRKNKEMGHRLEKIKKCEIEEAKFWTALIAESLFPADSNHPEALRIKSNEKQMQQEVRSTRNSYLLLIIVMNAVWLVLNISIQLVYDDLSITTKGFGCARTNCPADDVQPFTIFALIFYFIVLVVQYGCMLIHRVGSFIAYWCNADLVYKNNYSESKSVATTAHSGLNG